MPPSPATDLYGPVVARMYAEISEDRLLKFDEAGTPLAVAVCLGDSTVVIHEAMALFAFGPKPDPTKAPPPPPPEPKSPSLIRKLAGSFTGRGGKRPKTPATSDARKPTARWRLPDDAAPCSTDAEDGYFRLTMAIAGLPVVILPLVCALVFLQSLIGHDFRRRYFRSR